MPVLFALTAVLSTALGGFVALRSRDRLHLVLGFAAGVMLGLVAFDLLPELFELSDTMFLGVPTVMVAFAAGFLTLHCVERSVAMHGAHEGEYGAHDHHNPSVGFASALALVGALVPRRRRHRAGVPGQRHGRVRRGAGGHRARLRRRPQHRHDPAHPRQLAAAAAVDARGRRRGAGGRAISTLFFSVSDDLLALYLGGFAGFLLYLATADILPEAHARHPSRLTLVSTLGGVGLMWFVVAAG